MNKKVEGSDDLIVQLGDLRSASIEQVVHDDNYESMVEDYISDFNQMVTQGMPTIKALFAFAQGFAIVLGSCIRAGLRPAVGGKLVAMIVKNAQSSSKMVNIVIPGALSSGSGTKQ